MNTDDPNVKQPSNTGTSGRSYEPNPAVDCPFSHKCKDRGVPCNSCKHNQYRRHYFEPDDNTWENHPWQFVPTIPYTPSPLVPPFIVTYTW